MTDDTDPTDAPVIPDGLSATYEPCCTPGPPSFRIYADRVEMDDPAGGRVLVVRVSPQTR